MYLPPDSLVFLIITCTLIVIFPTAFLYSYIIIFLAVCQVFFENFLVAPLIQEEQSFSQVRERPHVAPENYTQENPSPQALMNKSKG
jgi:hypothetical protein